MALSVQEARELLPWVLELEEDPDPAIWNFLAQRLSIAILEAVAADLGGYDLTNLCMAGLDHWQPLRASLGLTVDPDGDGFANERWSFHGKLLNFATGDSVFRFASYGTALKNRPNSVSSATWELLLPGLSGVSVSQAVLRGLARSIRVASEGEGDVRGDIESVLESVQDRYYVDELTLRRGLAAEERSVRLTLGDQIAENRGKATMRDLVLSLAQVAAYRDPIELSEPIRRARPFNSDT